MSAYLEKYEHLALRIDKYCMHLKDKVYTDSLTEIHNEINNFREQIMNGSREELVSLYSKLQVNTYHNRYHLANKVYEILNSTLNFYGSVQS